MSETEKSSDTKPKVQRCETCKTFCVGDEAFEKHLQSQKHKDKVEGKTTDDTNKKDSLLNKKDEKSDRQSSKDRSESKKRERSSDRDKRVSNRDRDRYGRQSTRRRNADNSRDGFGRRPYHSRSPHRSFRDKTSRRHHSGEPRKRGSDSEGEVMYLSGSDWEIMDETNDDEESQAVADETTKDSPGETKSDINENSSDKNEGQQLSKESKTDAENKTNLSKDSKNGNKHANGGDENSKDKKTVCESCKMIFSNKHKYDQHCAGSKHKENTAGPNKKVAKIQGQIDRCSEPLLGLSLVLEVSRPLTEPLYRCILCNLECIGKTVMSHLTGNKHFLSYIQAFHPDLLSKLPPKKKVGNEVFEIFLKNSGINIEKEKVVVVSGEKEATDVTLKTCKTYKLVVPDYKKPSEKKKENYQENDEKKSEFPLTFKKKKVLSATNKSQTNKANIPKTLEEEIAFCKEPLLGLSYVLKVCSPDSMDWFYCLMCQYCCLKHELLEHVLSELHRKNYLMEFHEKIAKKLNTTLQMDNYIMTLTESKQKEKIIETTEFSALRTAQDIIRKHHLRSDIRSLEKILDQSRLTKFKHSEERRNTYAGSIRPYNTSPLPSLTRERSTIFPIDSSFQVQYPLPLKYRQQVQFTNENPNYGFNFPVADSTPNRIVEVLHRSQNFSSNVDEKSHPIQEGRNINKLSKLDEYFGFHEKKPREHENISRGRDRKRSSKDSDFSKNKRHRTHSNSPNKHTSYHDKSRSIKSPSLEKHKINPSENVISEENKNKALVELLKALLLQSSDDQILQSVGKLLNLNEESIKTLASSLLLFQNVLKSNNSSSNETTSAIEKPFVKSWGTALPGNVNITEYGHFSLEEHLKNQLMSTQNEQSGLSKERSNFIKNEIDFQELQDRFRIVNKQLDSKQLPSSTSDSKNKTLLEKPIIPDIDQYKSKILPDLLKMNEIAGMNLNPNINQNTLSQNSSLNTNQDLNTLDQLSTFIANEITGFNRKQSSGMHSNQPVHFSQNQSINTSQPHHFNVSQSNTQPLYNSKQSDIYKSRQAEEIAMQNLRAGDVTTLKDMGLDNLQDILNKLSHLRNSGMDMSNTSNVSNLSRDASMHTVFQPGGFTPESHMMNMRQINMPSHIASFHANQQPSSSFSGFQRPNFQQSSSTSQYARESKGFFPEQRSFLEKNSILNLFTKFGKSSIMDIRKNPNIERDTFSLNKSTAMPFRGFQNQY